MVLRDLIVQTEKSESKKELKLEQPNFDQWMCVRKLHRLMTASWFM